VLSGSMEPGFYRGDILFLFMGRRTLQAGEVRLLTTLTHPAPPCRHCFSRQSPSSTA